MKQCQSVVTWFKSSHQAGELLRQMQYEQLIFGGSLQTSVKTRWSTAWDCCDSIIRLENSLKHVS